MWSNWNFLTLLVGMQNSTVTLEKSLAVSYKVNHTCIINPKTPFLGIYPAEIKTYIPPQILYTNIYSSFLITASKGKQPKCLSTNKLWYPYRGIILSNKKKGMIQQHG